MKRSQTIAVLASGLGWHVQDLNRAAQIVDVDLNVSSFTSLCGRLGALEGARVSSERTALESSSCVLVRMVPPGSLEQVVARVDALHRLELLGIRVVNAPRAIEACVDKYLALARLEASGMPIPPTFVCESTEEALDAFEALGCDVVVKPIFGAEGRGLLRVQHRELARRTFQTLESLKSILYLQKYLANDGSDFRAFVLGGRVLGSIRRRAALGDWRTNLSQGGVGEKIVLDPMIERLAIDAARAVGAEVAGVDVVIDADATRPYVLEVNGAPGWRGLSRITGIDVASEVLSWLREQSL
jgi:RimK family alpha-L-glutamate ligase